MLKTIKNIILFLFFFVSITFTPSIFAQTADYRDVIINEIMANPSPSINEIPEIEYIEIFNRSHQAFDLTGWTLKDASKTIGVIQEGILNAGEFAIICKESDVSQFEKYGKVFGTPKWPILNNDKDSLILRNENQELIDALFYQDSWYQDEQKENGGYALELINPSLICSNEANWTASISPQGGTPGTYNSVVDVTADTTPPSINSLAIIDPKQIKISFSESIDNITAENPHLYILTPAIELDAIELESNHKNVIIHLSSPLIKGVTYQLMIFGISDCEGNGMKDTTITLFLGEQPKFNDLIITEIMADPTPIVQLPEEEYIELYNNSSKIIDLKDMTFTAGTRTATFPEGQLLPGEYALVVPFEAIDLFSTTPRVIGLEKFPTITNNGTELLIKNSSGDIIFSITFSDTWYESAFKKEGGWSLEMIDITQPCLSQINWKESIDPKGGTPGTPNSVQGTIDIHEELQPVAIEYHSNQSIQVIFSTKFHPELIHQHQIEFTPTLTIQQVNIVGTANNKIEISFDEEISNGIEYKMNLNSFYDCSGNAMKPFTMKLEKPALVEPGDIVINELLYDPKTGGEDFVELLNISNKTLSLSDMMIAREDAFDGSIIQQIALKEYKRLIFPNEYLVLSTKGSSIRNQYFTPGEGVFVDVKNFPNYINEGGVVALYRLDHVLLDRFQYDPKMHFQLLKHTKGVSLERVHPKIAANEKTNWNSAATAIGGATPGYENSQYLQPIPSGALSVSPEVFSPDGDGFDDLLGISYQLDNTNYVGTANVYTIDGVPVRKIFSNQTLAQNGFFTWDGLDERGKKARIGIYIIALEIFSLDGKKELLTKKCVVANR